jgi:hypothetical protein
VHGGVLPDQHCTMGDVGTAINAANLATTTCDPRYRSRLELAPGVLASAQNAIFDAYGIAAAKRGQYTIAFLVTPALGGLATYANLWPVPHAAQQYARYSALQIRLGADICSRKVGVQAAQYALVHDWTTANKVLRLT